ncbi:prepilin-type cleavage/methylation domain-containing protein [Pantoea stewartii]|nr:prepilin-type cleavage/methylation domain-containing protein [Pantoea stewartii]
MAVSTSALLQYHRVLTLGFSQQWQQREAWRVAEQRLLGREVAGWQTRSDKKTGSGGCTLETVTVSGPHQRQASLTRLHC